MHGNPFCLPLCYCSMVEIDYKEINALTGGSKIKKNIKKVIFFPKPLVQPKIVE